MEIARTMEGAKIPGWLTALINAEFLKRKGIQQDDLKYCCVDCASNSLTETETFYDHNNHRVLQAFKASGHYGYKLKDIQALQHCCLEFDIVSGVCVYSINRLSILYPKSRVKTESSSSKKISSTSTCCVTCGWTLIKDAEASFCSILCKLVNQFGGNPASVSPLKDQDCVQDRVFLEEEGEQRTLLVKFKIRGNNNNNGTTNSIMVDKKKKNEKVKVGANKRKKLAATCAIVNNSITEEIEGINGKKMSSLNKKKRKLQSLVSNAKEEEEEEEIKLQGFRKRSRKGVHRKPSRAPFF